MAVGMADITAAGGGESRLSDYWDSFLGLTFPFLEKNKSKKDAEMVEKMQKEVSRGPLLFSAQEMPNPFKDRVKRLTMEPSYAKRLVEARKSSRKL